MIYRLLNDELDLENAMFTNHGNCTDLLMLRESGSLSIEG
jgi:hypothetical protein